MWKTIFIIIALTIPAISETADDIIKSANEVLRIDGEKLSDSALFASFNMEVPKRHLIKEIPYPRPEPIQWQEPTIAGTILLTWISMGINEGQKWKSDRTGNINFMWNDDYHLYRGIHNCGLVAVPLIALSMDRNKRSVRWIVGSNLLGWGLYEMALSYAEGEDVTGTKPPFKLLGIKTWRPDALACLGISVLSTVAFTYTF